MWKRFVKGVTTFVTVGIAVVVFFGIGYCSYQGMAECVAKNGWWLCAK